MTSQVTVSVNVIGWLTEDATLKELTSTSACNFRVAAKKYNRQTKQKDDVFFNCTLWGKKAETFRKMLRKGKYVSVSGTIDSFRQVNINVQDICLLSQARAKEDKPAQPKQEEPKPEATPEKVAELF